MARKSKPLKEDEYVNPNDAIGETEIEEPAPHEPEDDRALNPEDIPEEEGLPMESVDIDDIGETRPKKRGPKS